MMLPKISGIKKPSSCYKLHIYSWLRAAHYNATLGAIKLFTGSGVTIAAGGTGNALWSAETTD